MLEMFVCVIKRKKPTIFEQIPIESKHDFTKTYQNFRVFPETTISTSCNYHDTAYSTRKIRDMATKPTKLEQINESPTNQFLPKKYSIAYILKNS